MDEQPFCNDRFCWHYRAFNGPSGWVPQIAQTLVGAFPQDSDWKTQPSRVSDEEGVLLWARTYALDAFKAAESSR